VQQRPEPLRTSRPLKYGVPAARCRRGGQGNEARGVRGARRPKEIGEDVLTVFGGDDRLLGRALLAWKRSPLCFHHFYSHFSGTERNAKGVKQGLTNWGGGWGVWGWCEGGWCGLMGGVGVGGGVGY